VIVSEARSAELGSPPLLGGYLSTPTPPPISLNS
jgi:hypothetical protein